MSTEPAPDTAALHARIAALEKKARRSWLRYAVLAGLGVVILNMLVAINRPRPDPWAVVSQEPYRPAR